MIKVLFVCLGNICRSPMAHMVFQNMVNEKGLETEFAIDSAGTEGYNEMCHAGIHRGTKEILNRKGIPFEIALPEKEDLVSFAENVSAVDAGKPSEKAKQIMRLYDEGIIDFETAEFAIMRLHKV